MKFLVADIGKSKTAVMILDEKLNVYCSVISGPGDISLEDILILRNISKAISECLSNASLVFSDLDLAVFTWAGLDTKRDYEIAWGFIERLGYRRDKVILERDAVTAYYAVTWGEPGIAVIAGTGAIAYGVNRSGECARSSGWGWIIGDEGGGIWIALQALNIAARAYDGRRPYTTLIEKIKEYFGVEDLLDIVTPIYRVKPLDISRIAGIAKIVDDEAERGDLVARDILTRAGQELALAAYSVAKKLNMIDDDIIVGGVGSVFASNTVRLVFEREVKTLLPRARLVEPLIGYKVLIGSIIIALRKLGFKINKTLVELIMKGVEEGEKKAKLLV